MVESSLDYHGFCPERPLVASRPHVDVDGTEINDTSDWARLRRN